jgi:uncharacterized protein (DUF2249 family)
MKEVDVRELPPPEPMTIIVNAMAELNEDERLLVHHSRQPYPLYDKLRLSGWQYLEEEKAENYFLITIWKE